MSRRCLEDYTFNHNDACRVSGTVKGRYVKLNATFIKMQKSTPDGEEQCLVRIVGGDPWSTRTNVTLVVPLSIVRKR
jgi:hypothetical protein